MITNNFILQWSQIPHFLGFHFISCKTNMKKIITLFPHHWPSFSVMYVLIHQHQKDSKWGGQELECCNKSPPGSYNCFQLLNVLEVLFFFCQVKDSCVSVIPTSIWKPPENPLLFKTVKFYFNKNMNERYAHLYGQWPFDKIHLLNVIKSVN